MERGQVFTLDFLISLIAATLAVGLLIQAVELRTYSQKESRLRNDLERVAENAGNMLVASNGITCELQSTYDGARIDYMNNCIDTTKISAANAGGLLGIPPGYDFNVSGAIEIGGPAPGETDFAEEARTVAVSSGAVTKDVFEQHSFTPVQVKIRVWRA